MIPLVGFKKEFDLQAAIVHATAKKVMAEKKVKFDYQVGTMIEVPRGALTADEIAQGAEFFSFGTNDLTQTALGIGGDPDSVKFCHKLGLAYVSCSPYRVPVARLAAAQAAIEEKRAAASKAVAPAKKAKKK